MNFPLWIRSELIFSMPPGVTVDEIESRVVRVLKRKGATGIERTAGRVQFRAGRATSNINPLAPCRSGNFEVKQDAQTFRIRYEIDLLYLVAGTAIVAASAAVIGTLLLIARSYLALLLMIGFIGVSVPVNYAFYSWRTKALFRAAALN